MLSTVASQSNLLLYSMFAGVLTGMLFDLYRVLRGFENPNKILTFIEDTLFWILTSIIVFIFLLKTNYAYMREYVYITIALGILIYIFVLSKSFIKVEYKIIGIIIKFTRIIFNYVFYPINLIFYRLKRKNKQKILKKKLEEN